MRNLLYIVAIVLILGWIISVFGFQVGGLIHVLLPLALVAVIVQVSTRKRHARAYFF
jgi:hypothetical protein